MNIKYETPFTSDLKTLGKTITLGWCKITTSSGATDTIKFKSIWYKETGIFEMRLEYPLQDLKNSMNITQVDVYYGGLSELGAEYDESYYKLAFTLTDTNIPSYNTQIIVDFNKQVGQVNANIIPSFQSENTEFLENVSDYKIGSSVLLDSSKEDDLVIKDSYYKYLQHKLAENNKTPLYLNKNGGKIYESGTYKKYKTLEIHPILDNNINKSLKNTGIDTYYINNSEGSIPVEGYYIYDLYQVINGVETLVQKNLVSDDLSGVKINFYKNQNSSYTIEGTIIKYKLSETSGSGASTDFYGVISYVDSNGSCVNISSSPFRLILFSGTTISFSSPYFESDKHILLTGTEGYYVDYNKDSSIKNKNPEYSTITIHSVVDISEKLKNIDGEHGSGIISNDSSINFYEYFYVEKIVETYTNKNNETSIQGYTLKIYSKSNNINKTWAPQTSDGKPVLFTLDLGTDKIEFYCAQKVNDPLICFINNDESTGSSGYTGECTIKFPGKIGTKTQVASLTTINKSDYTSWIISKNTLGHRVYIKEGENRLDSIVPKDPVNNVYSSDTRVPSSKSNGIYFYTGIPGKTDEDTNLGYIIVQRDAPNNLVISSWKDEIFCNKANQIKINFVVEKVKESGWYIDSNTEYSIKTGVQAGIAQYTRLYIFGSEIDEIQSFKICYNGNQSELPEVITSEVGNELDGYFNITVSESSTIVSDKLLYYQVDIEPVSQNLTNNPVPLDKYKKPISTTIKLSGTNVEFSTTIAVIQRPEISENPVEAYTDVLDWKLLGTSSSIQEKPSGYTSYKFIEVSNLPDVSECTEGDKIVVKEDEVYSFYELYNTGEYKKVDSIIFPNKSGKKDIKLYLAGATKNIDSFNRWILLDKSPDINIYTNTGSSNILNVYPHPDNDGVMDFDTLDFSKWSENPKYVTVSTRKTSQADSSLDLSPSLKFGRAPQNKIDIYEDTSTYNSWKSLMYIGETEILTSVHGYNKSNVIKIYEGDSSSLEEIDTLNLTTLGIYKVYVKSPDTFKITILGDNEYKSGLYFFDWKCNKLDKYSRSVDYSSFDDSDGVPVYFCFTGNEPGAFDNNTSYIFPTARIESDGVSFDLKFQRQYSTEGNWNDWTLNKDIEVSSYSYSYSGTNWITNKSKNYKDIFIPGGQSTILKGIIINLKSDLEIVPLSLPKGATGEITYVFNKDEYESNTSKSKGYSGTIIKLSGVEIGDISSYPVSPIASINLSHPQNFDNLGNVCNIYALPEVNTSINSSDIISVGDENPIYYYPVKDYGDIVITFKDPHTPLLGEIYDFKISPVKINDDISYEYFGISSIDYNNEIWSVKLNLYNGYYYSVSPDNSKTKIDPEHDDNYVDPKSNSISFGELIVTAKIGNQVTYSNGSKVGGFIYDENGNIDESYTDDEIKNIIENTISKEKHFYSITESVDISNSSISGIGITNSTFVRGSGQVYLDPFGCERLPFRLLLNKSDADQIPSYSEPEKSYIVSNSTGTDSENYICPIIPECSDITGKYLSDTPSISNLRDMANSVDYNPGTRFSVKNASGITNNPPVITLFNGTTAKYSGIKRSLIVFGYLDGFGYSGKKTYTPSIVTGQHMSNHASTANGHTDEFETSENTTELYISAYTCDYSDGQWRLSADGLKIQSQNKDNINTEILGSNVNTIYIDDKKNTDGSYKISSPADLLDSSQQQSTIKISWANKSTKYRFRIYNEIDCISGEHSERNEYFLNVTTTYNPGKDDIRVKVFTNLDDAKTAVNLCSIYKEKVTGKLSSYWYGNQITIQTTNEQEAEELKKKAEQENEELKEKEEQAKAEKEAEEEKNKIYQVKIINANDFKTDSSSSSTTSDSSSSTITTDSSTSSSSAKSLNTTTDITTVTGTTTTDSSTALKNRFDITYNDDGGYTIVDTQTTTTTVDGVTTHPTFTYDADGNVKSGSSLISKTITFPKELNYLVFNANGTLATSDRRMKEITNDTIYVVTSTVTNVDNHEISGDYKYFITLGNDEYCAGFGPDEINDNGGFVIYRLKVTAKQFSGSRSLIHNKISDIYGTKDTNFSVISENYINLRREKKLWIFNGIANIQISLPIDGWAQYNEFNDDCLADINFCHGDYYSHHNTGRFNLIKNVIRSCCALNYGESSGQNYVQFRIANGGGPNIFSGYDGDKYVKKLAGYNSSPNYIPFSYTYNCGLYRFSSYLYDVPGIPVDLSSRLYSETSSVFSSASCDGSSPAKTDNSGYQGISLTYHAGFLEGSSVSSFMDFKDTSTVSKYTKDWDTFDKNSDDSVNKRIIANISSIFRNADWWEKQFRDDLMYNEKAINSDKIKFRDAFLLSVYETEVKEITVSHSTDTDISISFSEGAKNSYQVKVKNDSPLKLAVISMTLTNGIDPYWNRGSKEKYSCPNYYTKSATIGSTALSSNGDYTIVSAFSDSGISDVCTVEGTSTWNTLGVEETFTTIKGLWNTIGPVSGFFTNDGISGFKLNEDACCGKSKVGIIIDADEKYLSDDAPNFNAYIDVLSKNNGSNAFDEKHPLRFYFQFHMLFPDENGYKRSTNPNSGTYKYDESKKGSNS